MTDADKPLINVVREGLERACKDFTSRVSPLGFSRTKKMFWTRRQDSTVDFVHLHRCGSTYGAPINASVSIRVHFGIRVLNDNFVAPALNGPYSDISRTRSGHYHLRFNALSGDTFSRCVDDLVRFVVEQGEPWFKKFNSIENLLDRADSPLRPNEKALLRTAQSGRAAKENVDTSLKILGLNGKK